MEQLVGNIPLHHGDEVLELMPGAGRQAGREGREGEGGTDVGEGRREGSRKGGRGGRDVGEGRRDINTSAWPMGSSPVDLQLS